METTKRLYYYDSFLCEFAARVVRVEIDERQRARIALDQTAFYPSAGGQPHDLGTLNDIEVEDVFEGPNKEIIHLVARAPDSEQVQGRIDWARRFDHMQQHTGQHILSAAFVRLFNFSTVSFHLGRASCSIDLDTDSVGQRQLQQVEELANQVVFEDRPVRVRFTRADELHKEEARGRLRREVEREGELRLIEVEDFDCCPCGGTHVARTGQIGLLLVRRVEKTKKHVRVEFVCGGRALGAARADHEHLSEAARLLTTGPGEVPALIRKRFEEQRAAERERSRVLEQLAEYEARALLAAAERVGERRVLCKVFDEADAGYLRLLAARLVKESDVQLVFGSRKQPAALVFAQSRGLPGEMSVLLRETVQRLGGKGGGSRDFAQGSVPAGTPLEEVLAEVLRKLRG
ncbi:MAG: DHHA1 domain-containing protein [Terriglobia bacterium]